MHRLSSILVATDFSVDGNNAVRRAAQLAHQHEARLHILHVLHDGGSRPLREWFTPLTDVDLKAALARAALRRVAIEIAGAYDVTATVEVRLGDPLHVVTQAAEQAELVVLGHRGQRRMGTLLVGGTADRLLRTCRRPVLVVKRAAEGPYRTALMPVDFTIGSEAAVRVGAAVAAQARTHVFHAAESYVASMLRRAGAERGVIDDVTAREEAGALSRMRRLLATAGVTARPVVFSVGRGPADLAALAQARALRADLIVAGKNGRSTLGSFLLGSVSRELLAGSDCDMLIVPRPRAADVAPAPLPRPRALVAAHWMHRRPGFARRRSP